MHRIAILVALALSLTGLVVTSAARSAAGAGPWSGAVIQASEVGSSWPLRAASAQLACFPVGDGIPTHNAVIVIVPPRRYALNKQGGWLGGHPIAPILRAGESGTSGGVVALRLLAHRLCLPPKHPSLACDIIRDPPAPCDPFAFYPHAQASLCRATCSFASNTEHLNPAPGRIVLRVTVDPPDVSARGVATDCAGGIVPFVVHSGDTIDLASEGASCYVSATALWTEPFIAGARHIVTMAIILA
jgi:hypothetical protein